MIIVIILLFFCISCAPSDEAIISLAIKNDSFSGYNWLIQSYSDYYYRCPDSKESIYKFAIDFREGADMDDESFLSYLEYANSLKYNNVLFCVSNDTCFLYNTKTGVGCVEYCGFSKLINNLENPAGRQILPRFFDIEGNPLFIDSYGLEKRIRLLTRFFPGYLSINNTPPPFTQTIVYRELYSYSRGAISPLPTDVEYNREGLKWKIGNHFLDLEKESLSAEYQNYLLQIMIEWCDSFPEIYSIVFPMIFVCGEMEIERVYLEDYPIEERHSLLNIISVYDLSTIDGLKSAIKSSHVAAFYEFNNLIAKGSQIIDGELVYYWLTTYPSFVLDYLEYDSNLRNDYLQLLSTFFIEKPEEYESFRNSFMLNRSSTDFLGDLDIMIIQGKCAPLNTL